MRLELSRELKKIFLSILFMILSFLIKDIKLVFIIISYVIISFDIYKEAFEHLKDKYLFGEEFLMIVATLGSFYIGEYVEGVLVMLLYSIGEYLSDLAVDRSRRSITDLLDLRSNVVHIKVKNKVIDKNIKDVKIRDVFIVKPGERIPVDGKVVKGDSYIDTSSLTGESIPMYVSINDMVLSGCICNDSSLEIEATSTYETSTVTKIVDLMQNSNEKKTNTEKFITRFSKVYTPLVCLLALIILILLLLLGYDFNTSLYKSLIFLVISCPCALVISVPLGFFMGIGRASKEGILIKGSNELEKLSNINNIVFDKTGTLTKGVFEVTKIYSDEIDNDELLELVAYSEYYSNHPIGKSIMVKYGKEIDKEVISDFKEKSGEGIDVYIKDRQVILGTIKHLRSHNIEVDEIDSIGTVVYVAGDGKYLGYIEVSDVIKPEAYSLVDNLNINGIDRVIVLSGDDERIVSNVCKKLNISEYYSNLLPLDKVNKIEDIKASDITAFVGDGINDAPVIKVSDVGISMGGIGSDATIEASDVVLINDNLDGLVDAIKISKLTKVIVVYNICFSLAFKVLVMILGLLGISSILMAVFADVGVTLLTIINTLIIFKKKI